MTEIQELREIVQAQALRLTDTRAVAQLNEYRIRALQNRIITQEKRLATLQDTLADARCHLALLTRLVERMGRDLDGYINADYGTFEDVNPASRYPYTVAGQREYDAVSGEAEGPPPDAGMLEAVQ